MGLVDVVAEIIMWLIYADLTGGMALSATSGPQALLYGAAAGLGAQLYRDGATWLGLADKRRMRRLVRRSRSAGAKVYFRQALGGATLFFLYDQILYPSFDKFGVESSVELQGLGLADPASVDPFINFRKNAERWELVGARKMRPLFNGVVDDVPSPIKF